jgi:hypothetical protein
MYFRGVNIPCTSCVTWKRFHEIRLSPKLDPLLPERNNSKGIRPLMHNREHSTLAHSSVMKRFKPSHHLSRRIHLNQLGAESLLAHTRCYHGQSL